MISRSNSRRPSARRPGAIMIVVVLCIIGLFGLLALAIEIGLVAVGRSQAQNAADAAAMAGARTINADSADNYGLSAAPANAVKVAHANSILSQVIAGDSTNVVSTGTDTYGSGQVSLVFGTYGYNYNDTDPTKEGFGLVFPRAATSTEPYSAVQATVTGSANLNFARVFGMSSRDVQATAVAAHRPRDVFIIMDLSGSMRFQSLPGTPYSGNRTNSMNPDPDYPKFGHYSDTAGAALYGNTSYPVGTGEYYDPANISYTTNSGPPILEDFYQNAVGTAPSSGNRAFTRGNANYATTPGGDNFLKTYSGSTFNSGSNYAHTTQEFNNNSANTNVKFETNGYGQYQTWNGYTEGPSYWGKTFFVWPPNPGFTTPGNWTAPSSITDTSYKWCTWNDSIPRDWRHRFFVAVKGTTAGVIQHNSILFDSTGNLKTPGTTTAVTENNSSVNYTFQINYAAILYWLQQSPVHFPSTIQAGRIRYYTAIPDGTDNALNNRWWTTAPSSLVNNERFWKEYIDYVLGYMASTSTAVSYSDISTKVGNGDFYTWSGSTVAVNQRADRPSTPFVNLHTSPTSPYQTGVTGPYQTSTTAPYQTTTTTSSKSIGSGTVSVNTLTSTPVSNQNYVTFSGSLAIAYKIVPTSTKTSLTISPNLSILVPSGATANVYSSNNAVGATEISVATLANTPSVVAGPDVDYIGFNNTTTDFYALTAPASTTKQTIAAGGLSSAVNLSAASVQVYASPGAVGSTQISVNNLSSAPVANKDYVIFGTDTANPYLITSVSSQFSNGAYILALASSTGGGLVNAVPINNTGNGTAVKIYSPYMNYADDVLRPKHHFWFGPQTWVDWLGNYNLTNTLTNVGGDPHLWWPGNVHEAQAWACKVGIQTAIDDIKKNHPNDYLGMCFFSDPMNSRTDSTGHHNRAVVPLGRAYQQLKDSLWFPPSTVTGTATEITPYDADFLNVPRANGGTSPGMGFMIAYNQLSNSVSSLRGYATPSTTYRGSAGGLGRKGSSRVIIFETDGVPNTQAYAAIVNQAADSYYPIRIQNPANLTSSSNVEFPTNSSFAISEVYDVVKQIAANDTASPPGFSNARHKTTVFPIAYGSLFDPANASAKQTTALDIMQTIANYGNTASDTSGANFPDLYRVYGTNDQRVTRMQKAFSSIMQSGTQLTLLK